MYQNSECLSGFEWLHSLTSHEETYQDFMWASVTLVSAMAKNSMELQNQYLAKVVRWMESMQYLISVSGLHRTICMAPWGQWSRFLIFTISVYGQFSGLNKHTF